MQVPEREEQNLNYSEKKGYEGAKSNHFEVADPFLYTEPM